MTGVASGASNEDTLVTYYINDVQMGQQTVVNGSVYNKKMGPRLVHNYNKTSDAIASGFGVAYDYVNIKLY